AYRAQIDSTRALAGKVYDGRDFLGLNPAHLPSEEVSDVIQHNVNFFPELEEAADEVLRRGAFDRSDMFRSLAQHARESHCVTVELTPVSRDRGAVVRRFDPERRTLALSEVLPPWSRQFQVAHQIGLLDARPVIDAILARSENLLTTPESATLCR